MADGSGLLFKEAAESTVVSEIFGAAKQGDLETFTNILNKMPTPEEQIALLNKRGMWGSTLLIFAIQYGHKKLAQNILDRDEIDTHAVNEKGGGGVVAGWAGAATPATRPAPTAPRASTARCTLPPESCSIGVSPEGVLTR